ncbi:MAG: hypothetical protein EPO06_02340 [Burkholderiaceae bacterium]|nr:MAG: hypothetical protein EPO06_02340 [Burkholderiaceae bacterium]
MKLHASNLSHLNTVTALAAEYVDINRVRYGHSIIVAPEGPVQSWPVSDFAQLSADDFANLLPLQPEIVLLGTGSTQRFVHPRLTQALQQQRIGVESMDTAAACRTYNILMAEGRKVVAALIIDQRLNQRLGTVYRA